MLEMTWVLGMARYRILDWSVCKWSWRVVCGTCDSSFCTCYAPVLAVRFAPFTVARCVKPLLLIDTSFLSVVLFNWTVLRDDAVSKEHFSSLLFSFNWTVLLKRNFGKYMTLNVTYKILFSVICIIQIWIFISVFKIISVLIGILCHHQISANWLLLIVFIIGQEVGSGSPLWVKVSNREFVWQTMSLECLLLACLYLESVNSVFQEGNVELSVTQASTGNICNDIEITALSDYWLQLQSFVFVLSCTQPDDGLLKAETKYVVFDRENSFIVLICGCEFQGFHSSVTGHSSNLGCDIVLHSWHFEGMCCFHLGTNEDEVDTFLPNVGSHLTQWSSALHSRRPHLSTVSYSFTSVLWWF